MARESIAPRRSLRAENISLSHLGTILSHLGTKFGNEFRNSQKSQNFFTFYRLAQSTIGQKIQDAANKIESGANYMSGNEDRAQQALSTISRKINA